MALSIINSDSIYLNRKSIIDGEEKIVSNMVGNYHFEANLGEGLKQCNMGMYLINDITDETELEILSDIFSNAIYDFMVNTNYSAWHKIFEKLNKKIIDNSVDN